MEDALNSPRKCVSRQSAFISSSSSICPPLSSPSSGRPPPLLPDRPVFIMLIDFSSARNTSRPCSPRCFFLSSSPSFALCLNRGFAWSDSHGIKKLFKTLDVCVSSPPLSCSLFPPHHPLLPSPPRTANRAPVCSLLTSFIVLPSCATSLFVLDWLFSFYWSGWSHIH